MGHAQWVFTIPKMLRVYFLHHRELLAKLSQAAAQTAKEFLAAAATEEKGFRPGLVTVVQTFGDRANFHPHVARPGHARRLDGLRGVGLLAPGPGSAPKGRGSAPGKRLRRGRGACPASASARRAEAPLGEPDPEGLRGGPARVSSLRSRDARHRLHHGAESHQAHPRAHPKAQQGLSPAPVHRPAARSTPSGQPCVSSIPHRPNPAQRSTGRVVGRTKAGGLSSHHLGLPTRSTARPPPPRGPGRASHRRRRGQPEIRGRKQLPIPFGGGKPLVRAWR